MPKVFNFERDDLITIWFPGWRPDEKQWQPLARVERKVQPLMLPHRVISHFENEFLEFVCSYAPKAILAIHIGEMNEIQQSKFEQIQVLCSMGIHVFTPLLICGPSEDKPPFRTLLYFPPKEQPGFMSLGSLNTHPLQFDSAEQEMKNLITTYSESDSDEHK